VFSVTLMFPQPNNIMNRYLFSPVARRNGGFVVITSISNIRVIQFRIQDRFKAVECSGPNTFVPPPQYIYFLKKGNALKFETDTELFRLTKTKRIHKYLKNKHNIKAFLI
jgi:hypothetical protein